MVPGFLVWATFILAIVLSFIKPLWVVIFIIAFDIFWLLRVIYFVFYLSVSWRRYRAAIKTDWKSKLEELEGWKDIFHIIFLPTAGEPLEVLRTTFDSLVNTGYPLEKFIVVLAGEGRMEEDFWPKAKKIEEEYGHLFHKLLITVHPDGMPGEIKGKGANANYAGRQARKYIDKEGIPYKKIIVSYFDSDTCVHRKYFHYLTYKYLTHPDPTKTSFQPVALYNNNMWDSPAIMRVAAFGTTFWLLTELARPERLFTFSSHSMSWQALVDVGFWQKNIVTDDSRIFLQCFLRYNGNYSVTPMYIPVSMDTVMAGTFWQSLKNLYKQQRRWAWGVEHFPYMIWEFLHNKKIALGKKIKYFWNLTEGMYSWATAPILIFVLGRLPLWVGEDKIKDIALTQNVPFTLEWLMRMAMAGIFVSAILSVLLLPPKPKARKWYSYIIMLFQWALLPFTLIFFGSIPAIEAQTRLMFGKYLGFWVTKKARK